MVNHCRTEHWKMGTNRGQKSAPILLNDRPKYMHWPRMESSLSAIPLERSLLRTCISEIQHKIYNSILNISKITIPTSGPVGLENSQYVEHKANHKCHCKGYTTCNQKVWYEAKVKIGLGDISILSPLCNIRVCNISSVSHFHMSIISHVQHITEYCHTSPNTTTGLSVHTKFTLTNNTETHRSLLISKFLHQLLLNLLKAHMLDDAVFHLLQ